MIFPSEKRLQKEAENYVQPMIDDMLGYQEGFNAATCEGDFIEGFKRCIEVIKELNDLTTKEQ